MKGEGKEERKKDRKKEKEEGEQTAQKKDIARVDGPAKHKYLPPKPCLSFSS